MAKTAGARPRVTEGRVADTPLALLPSWFSRVRGEASLVALDGPHGGARRAGSVSVLPVYGVIEHRSDWLMELFGEGTSVESLRESLRAELADPSVQAVVLDIDSPGGSIAGVTELAAEIRAARGGTKPIVAVANTLAASAAYWLGSQADEFVATPSGNVGSIGVYAIHQDVSRMLDEMGITMTIVSAGPHKTEGNEFEPLSDEARADIQARVDASYAQFLGDVAAGRRVPVATVEEDFGGGRVFTARDAVKAGMVDRVETLGQTISRLSGAGGRRRALAADLDAPDLMAEADADGEHVPFTERLAALADEAAELVGHATERARLRAKEGRPAFSTTTERSLRTIREAIDDLLAPDDPEPPAEPDEPVAAVTPPPARPAVVRRFHSDDDWLAFLRETAS